MCSPRESLTASLRCARLAFTLQVSLFCWLLPSSALSMQVRARKGVRVYWYHWLIKVQDNRKKMWGDRMKDSKSKRVMWMLLSCLMLLPQQSTHGKWRGFLTHAFRCVHMIFTWTFLCSFLLECIYNNPCPPTGCQCLETFCTFPLRKWQFWVRQIGFTRTLKNLLVSNQKTASSRVGVIMSFPHKLLNNSKQKTIFFLLLA